MRGKQDLLALESKQQCCCGACFAGPGDPNFFWDSFKKAVKQVPKETAGPRRFVPPVLAEWFAGRLE